MSHRSRLRSRLRSRSRSRSRSRTARLVKLGGALLALALLLGLPYWLPLLVPAMQQNPFLLYKWLNVLVAANVLAILGMSWDLLGGYAGQISFGHSLFLGLGAYTTAILSVLYGWNPWLIIALGGLVAAVGGLLVAAPALRLHGPYLSLMTLVAALAFDRLMRWLKPEVGIPGAEGAILCVPHCVLTLDAVLKYYYSLGLMLLTALLLWALTRSRVGLALEAVRDDEAAAQAAGLNAAKYKTLAFGVSSFFAGIAGAFYVYHIGSAAPADVLNLQRSVEAIAVAVLGGMGTIFGAIGGALFFKVFEELLRPAGTLRFALLFSLALLILLLVRSGALGRLWAGLRPRPSPPREGAEAPPAVASASETEVEVKAKPS